MGHLQVELEECEDCLHSTVLRLPLILSVWLSTSCSLSLKVIWIPYTVSRSSVQTVLYPSAFVCVCVGGVQVLVAVLMSSPEKNSCVKTCQPFLQGLPVTIAQDELCLPLNHSPALFHGGRNATRGMRQLWISFQLEISLLPAPWNAASGRAAFCASIQQPFPFLVLVQRAMSVSLL